MQHPCAGNVAAAKPRRKRKAPAAAAAEANDGTEQQEDPDCSQQDASAPVSAPLAPALSGTTHKPCRAPVTVTGAGDAWPTA